MIILFIYQGYIIGRIQWTISLIYQEEIGSCKNNTKALKSEAKSHTSYFSILLHTTPIANRG